MKKTSRDSLTGPIISVPWNSDFPHISTRSRRRSLRCATLKYEEYSGGRAPCERRRSRADICEKSLIQGTSARRTNIFEG